MRLLILLLSLALAACGGSDAPADAPAAAASPATPASTAGAAHGHDHGAMAEAMYSCPMHPEITGKKGDRCSECNMFLTQDSAEVKAKDAPPPHGAAGHDHAVDHQVKDADGSAAYYCPMHPEVTSEKDGQRCGKCNMFLVKPGDEAKHTGG